jgi:hypothetical protein
MNVNVFNLLIYIINVLLAIKPSAIENIINIPNISSQIFCYRVRRAYYTKIALILKYLKGS